jgi:hypothetical protein
MTRKRFKKLCMGLGFERDRAEGFCWLAFALSPSYAAAWDAIRLALEARAAEGGDGGAMRASLPTREEATVCE